MDQTSVPDNKSGIPTSISREALYEAVWSEPATHLAAKYGVSDSFLARVCKRLHVPRPQPGYWAKQAVGKAPPKPALPPAAPGDEIQWLPANPLPPKQRRRPPTDRPPRPPSPQVAAITEAVPSPRIETSSKQTGKNSLRHKRVPAIHPLIEGAIGLIPIGRISEEGYYKPRKRLLPDILTSSAQLESIVRIANKLYRHLESRGHRVRMANASEHFQRREVDPRPATRQPRYYDSLWHPERPTVIYVDTVAIGLSLFETLESVEMQYVRGEYVPVSKMTNASRALLGSSTWTTQRLIPSGEFCLQAYSPYAATDWVRRWQGKPNTLTNQFEEIVAALEAAPATIRTLIEQARLAAEQRKRQWEESEQRRRREEQAKHRLKMIETARAELLSIIEDWNESKRIEAFFHEVLTQGTDGSEQARAEIERKRAAAWQLFGGGSTIARLAQWRAPDEKEDI